MNCSHHPPIFDGHNDSLTRLYPPLGKTRGSFLERQSHGHLDLPRAREGGLGGGLFAIFVEEAEIGDLEDADFLAWRGNEESPLAPPLDPIYALRGTLSVLARLFRMEARSGGRVRVVQDVETLEDCLESGVLAVAVHLEGAEALDRAGSTLEVLVRAGVRSLGPVWSRPNAFGTGVPFRFPSSPDTGPGLTRAGRRLVEDCNRLGVMLDVSHLNERGFWDVARLSRSPLVATHSAAHSLCPSARNLTDDQLDAIAETGGMVGVNFFVGDLHPEGLMDPDTPLEVLVAHVDYMVERMGLDHVGFGSDFDGAPVPADLGDAAGLPRLLAALEDAGYRGPDLEKLCWRNWVRVLGESWKPRPWRVEEHGAPAEGHPGGRAEPGADESPDRPPAAAHPSPGRAPGSF